MNEITCKCNFKVIVIFNPPTVKITRGKRASRTFLLAFSMAFTFIS